MGVWRLGVFFLSLGFLVAPALAQQTLIGGFSVTPPPCLDGTPGFAAGSLTATVQPSLSSLAGSGGSFSGTVTGGGEASDCGKVNAFTVSLTISGTVSAGGAVSFTLTGTVADGTNLSASGTGTASSLVTVLSGTLTAVDHKGEMSTGPVTLAGLSPASLVGSFTAGGSIYCDQPNGFTTIGQFTASAQLIVNTQPALGSLTAGGGTFTGSLSGSGTTALTCDNPKALSLSGNISGTVSAGGSVAWTYTLNVSDGKNPITLTGSGSGTTSSLTATGTSFVSTHDASPISYSITLSGAGSGSGLPALQVPGGGGSAVITLPGGTVGAPYAQNLPAAGGSGLYSWSVAGGALPAGLTLSSAGYLSGTPTQAGGALFTARVSDGSSFSSSTFALKIAPQSVTITTTSLPNANLNCPYPAQTLGASGGTPPYTFQITGSLPPGLTFANGVISGAATGAGTDTFTVIATDSGSPAQTASLQLSLTVTTGTGNLLLSQNSATFTLPNGASDLPPGIRISVQSSSASLVVGYSVAVNPAVPWLSVRTGVATPGAINLNLTPGAFNVAANTQTSVVVTCGPASSCAGSSQTIMVSLNRTTAAPQLVVTTPALTFTFTSSNSQPVSQNVYLQNNGGGQIYINSLSSPDSFVTISGNPVSLEGGPPSFFIVTVDPTKFNKPGFYQSSVTAVTSAGSVTIPLTVLLAARPVMTLSPAGTIFNAQAGSLPGNPNGSFQVSVTGGGTVNWTATALPGASWLTVNTPSGTSTAANPGTVNFSINSAAASLAAKPYYGAIQVTSPDVVDSPRRFIVVLNIVSAVTAVTPNPQPAGLLFIASSGTPPAQSVKVFAGTTASLPFQAASDSTWLSVTPTTGNTSSTAPASTSVSVNLSGLKAGIYTGGVSYALFGAAVRTVNVTVIVEPGAVTASQRTGPAPLATGTCTPANLVPVENGLVNSFSQPAAWPTPLSILLVNDCGQPVTNGQIVATFSNGDPPLILPPADTTTGTYSATWTPGNTGQQIAITVRASAANFPSATTQIAGQVTPNAAPALTPNGTLNAFAIAAEPGIPFAPGMIVQIYGTNLASQAASGSVIPLPTSINQTSVIIGGIEAPLYYVSPGQINAQVPFELAAGNPYELIVNANGALSTPYTLQLVSDSPGIAQSASGGIIAQHADYSLVTESAPARPGEYLQIYLVGMGLTNQTVPSGTASPSTTLANDLNAPTLMLNGAAVDKVIFAGLTPTTVGLYQVNFQVPANTPNGDQPLVITQASGVSNSTVLPVHN